MNVSVTSKDLIKLEEKYKIAIEALDKVKFEGVYPVYPAEVNSFFSVLAEEPWVDHRYEPNEVENILGSIDSASMTQIRWVLTWIMRSERFCNGNWNTCLRERKLDPVIIRIKELLNV